VKVTLTDYTPVEVYDDVPWTQALLYESPSGEDGTWTLIETFTLDPVDPDPENPITREFTSDLATLANGWYQIVWQNADLDQSKTPPVQNLQAVRAYRPLVSDVAGWLRTRTVDTNAQEQGTFTAATRPTYEQADRVIDGAMEKLEAKFGPNMQAELVGSAKNVVALRAAMMIELSFFADQIRADRSPYQELKALYEEALTDWQTERRSLGPDGAPDTPDDTSGNALPRAIFPPPATRIPSDSSTGLGWDGAIW